LREKEKNIEVIDKRINRIYFVSIEHIIRCKEVLISLKELLKKNKKIEKIIYQEDESIDICYVDN
jgi:hypothetical protein